MFSRIVSSFLVALIMFFSMKHLGFSSNAAMVSSLIPLVLGSMGILSSFAYMLTGVCFIVSCGATLLPELGAGAKTVGDLANISFSPRNVK